MVAALWAMSRRRRNKLMHMLNGNTAPWARVGRPPGEARLLQELQPVGKLRAAGWTIPPEVGDGYQLRVYDERIWPDWLQGLAAEVGGGPGLPSYMVGGDFLTQPHLEDAAALHPTELRRWGPGGDAPYRLVVPPRPHVAAWVQRCAAQMRMEAPGTVLLMCALVPRDQCGGGGDLASLRRMLPQAGPLLEDVSLQVEVKVVGERAPLMRVPAKGDDRVLPPGAWEHAWVPMDRVLVVLVVRRAGMPWQAPVVGSVRGELPVPKSDDLELLRLEYQLPPATRQARAESTAWSALKKLAGAMGLMVPPGPQTMRQVVVQHGGVMALLAVPRAQALHWLRGSGCGGLYLRPFWTARTDASISRERFSLLWLRGKAEQGPALWEVFKDKEGFAGLLLAGRDLALRVTHNANVEQLQAQLALFLGGSEGRFRQAVKGQKWWRLGPLTEAESWRALDMIRSVGLEPLRGELRHARLGRWRFAVYFAAVGAPSKVSFDDGSRGCSEAFFLEVSPPPRRVAFADKGTSGGALAEGSIWAGPRRQPPLPTLHTPGPQPTAGRNPAPVDTRPLAPLTGEVEALGHVSSLAPTPPPRPTPPLAEQGPSLPRRSPGSAPPDPQPPKAGYPVEGDRSRARGPVKTGRGGARRDSRADELEELRGLIQELREELRALRRENELLRRAQVLEGRQFAVPAHAPQRPGDPSPLPPLPTPTFSPVYPIGDDVQMDCSTLGWHAREQGGTPEAKRAPGGARTSVVGGHDDE